MTDWKPLTGRISLFAALPGATSVLDLYRQIWGVDPDGFQNSQNALAPSVAQGKRNSLMVTCAAQPTRIDLSFGPAATPADVRQNSLAVIQDASELSQEMERICRAISGGIVPNPINRVAVFLQFVSIQASVIEANKSILSAMPERLRVELGDEESFSLQINPVVESASSRGARLNLLTKWSVERAQVITFALPTTGDVSLPLPVGMQNYQPKEYVVASVGFDYNCVPVPLPLEPAQQSVILLELLNFIRKDERRVGLSVEEF